MMKPCLRFFLVLLWSKYSIPLPTIYTPFTHHDEGPVPSFYSATRRERKNHVRIKHSLIWRLQKVYPLSCCPTPMSALIHAPSPIEFYKKRLHFASFPMQSNPFQRLTSVHEMRKERNTENKIKKVSSNRHAGLVSSLSFILFFSFDILFFGSFSPFIANPP